MLVVTITLLVLAVSTAHAQDQTCGAKLIPCAQYLNYTTSPPNSCCDPIKEAVANDLPCLCNLYNNPDFLSGFKINITQALGLPRLCGLSNDVTVCKNAQAPSGSTTQPGSTPGGNNAGKIASSGVVGLLFISTCVMLF
ncbi:non-specific lipid transfer protein GPI-anchored 7-like [Bidens hawaiensis]